MGLALCFLLFGAVYYYSAAPHAASSAAEHARSAGGSPHPTLKRVRKPIEAEAPPPCAGVVCDGPPGDCGRGRAAFKHGAKTAGGCCPQWECGDVGQAPHEFRILFHTTKVGGQGTGQEGGWVGKTESGPRVFCFSFLLISAATHGEARTGRCRPLTMRQSAASCRPRPTLS